jgi:hypothetical protein
LNDLILQKIKHLIQNESYVISRTHIERDRPWREITVPDVLAVLATGTLGLATPKKAKWYGNDYAGRKLCLFLLGIDRHSHGCTWEQAEALRVKAVWLDEGKIADELRRKRYFEEKT